MLKLSETLMEFYTKVGQFGNKLSDITNSIFYGSIVLTGIESGKIGFNAQVKAYRTVFRKGFVVIYG